MLRAVHHRASCLVKSVQRRWLEVSTDAAAKKRLVENCVQDLGQRFVLALLLKVSILDRTNSLRTSACTRKHALPGHPTPDLHCH